MGRPPFFLEPGTGPFTTQYEQVERGVSLKPGVSMYRRLGREA
ncbi:hypothetical protein KNP414_04177 [Paenibacillus mucilaginosus KNP414]|uniref:Uncharacterized protein n=1 Tax=Paenibacillus mucilaginosus (strain KNP414) TaxID=1036673 RepID=F8FFT2_PAEMK|nr:hypothetical protein KNP414_04177 [Paenibacillus mucilaginosus KNP414]